MKRRGFLQLVAAVLTGTVFDVETPRWGVEMPDRWVDAESARAQALRSPLTIEQIDQAMKVIFQKPILDNIASDSELMSLFETSTIKDATGDAYIEQGHYWTLPAGRGWESAA